MEGCWRKKNRNKSGLLPGRGAEYVSACQHCCQALFWTGTFTQFTRFLRDFTWFLRNFMQLERINWKNMTRNEQISRPAETEPYMLWSDASHFTLLAIFDFFLCLRIKFHKSLLWVPILAAGGPYWVPISQKVGSLFHKKLGPYFKAWGSLLVYVTVLLTMLTLLTMLALKLGL